jgi:hypothetical protein
MKPRSLILVVLLALLLASWWGRTEFAEIAISSAMRGYGLNNITTEIDQLGISRSRFSNIAFTVATDDSRFRLIAESMTLDYTAAQLSRGRVESIVIDRLVLSHQTLRSTVTSAVAHVLEPAKIIAALRQTLRQYLIVNRVEIKALSLNGESFGILEHKPLQLRASTHGDGITAELSLLKSSPTGEPVIIRKLLISRLSNDAFEAELLDPQRADTVAGEFKLNLLDKSIDGDYWLEPGTLIDWLQPFTKIKAIGSIEKISGRIALDVSAADQIKTKVNARTDRLSIGGYQVDDLEISIAARNELIDALQHTHLDSESYVRFSSVSHPEFLLGKTRVDLAGDLYASGDPWLINGNVNADAVKAVYDAKSIRLRDIIARIKIREKTFDIVGSLYTATVPGKFSFELDHNLVKESGRLAIRPLKSINLEAESDKLSLLTTPWPYPFDLLNGTIKLYALAAWSRDKNISLNTRVKIDNASGHHEEMVFAGLTVDHEVQILPSLRSVKPSKILLDRLDNGVLASGISTTFSINTTPKAPLPRILLSGLNGEIFGGRFGADEIVFDLNETVNRFVINAKAIDLSAIVAAQQLEDIEVTGRVDGEIPVTFSTEGVFVEHGLFFNNVRAGTIRYHRSGGSDQLKKNPLTGIALDALKDFRYSHLSADVNYDPDGMLMVSLQLKGTSPELDTTRPVHLNINTEQNLLSLLKSLRYADSIGASIDQRVRKLYDQSSSKRKEKQ